MKKILDLIRVDLVTMNGGKNNLKTIAVITILFCLGVSFFVSPLGGVYFPFLMGTFFVPLIFNNEQKYHSEKLHCILPVSRKDIVDARFLLSTVLYMVIGTIFYFLVFLSLKLKLYNTFMGEFDILKLTASMSNQNLTEAGLLNISYSASFALGIYLNAGSLKKYFRSKKIMSLKRSDKKEIILVAALIVVAVLIVYDVIPIIPVLGFMSSFMFNIASAGNGFLFTIFILSFSIMKSIYDYICTIIEFEEKEL